MCPADRGLNNHRFNVRSALIDLLTEKIPVTNEKCWDLLRRVFGADISFYEPVLHFGLANLAGLRQFGVPNVVWETPACVKSQARSILKPISKSGQQEPLLEFLGKSLYYIIPMLSSY